MHIIFFIFFILPILISCSNDLFYNHSRPDLSVEAAFYRNSDEYKTLLTKDTLATGSSVQFQAKINPSSSDVKSFYWLINSQKNPNLQFSYTFSSSGFYIVNFYAIDRFGDTLTKDLAITVSNEPTCEKNLSLEYYQGSPIFSWECRIEEPIEKLSYNFKLIDIETNKVISDTTLQENTLQFGFALPSDFEVNLIASNSYGLKSELNYRSSDE